MTICLPSLGVTRVAIGMCMSLFASATAASTISADSALDLTYDSTALSSSYDEDARILFIGADHAARQQTKGVVIIASRASDLVGVPLNIVARGRIAGLNLKAEGSLPNGRPLSSLAITSRFGLRSHPITGLQRVHQGIDLAATMGTPDTATSDGIVEVANWQGGYGLLVSLNHGAGIQSRYGHLSSLNVSPGQTIRKG